MAKQIAVIKIPPMTSVGMEVIHPVFSFDWFCFMKSVLDQHFCKCLLQTRAHIGPCPYRDLWKQTNGRQFPPAPGTHSETGPNEAGEGVICHVQ